MIKLQAPGGQATPAPPVGPALGQRGVNIAQFVQQFNAKTSNLNGMILPIEITVYSDKSFTFIVKSPPAANLIKEAAQVAKGSGVPNRDIVGSITRKQAQDIAERKMKDLNAFEIDAATRIIEGTARSMGVEVVD